MPKKYHVAIRHAPRRHAHISKVSRFEQDGCLGCLECVKRGSCLYEVYTKARFDPELVLDFSDDLCVNCFRCVQECKKNILSRAPNPRFAAMGDDYWTPDLVAATWRQAETGRIPVSGAGYRGPFVGPGFDQMWTDMSEIVRPTRDGIHGREYVSTIIELGRRPPALEFDDNGAMVTEPPLFREIAVPIVFDIPDRGVVTPAARTAMALAAAELQTVCVATAAEARNGLSEFRDHLLIKTAGESVDAPMVEIPADGDVEGSNGRIISVRIPLDPDAPDRAAALAAAGVGIIHLQADSKGRGFGDHRDRFITDLVRSVHLRLTGDAVRDQVTVLVSGGIATAEHVAKTIICGADGVGINRALMAALQCRLCGECENGRECEAGLSTVDVRWAAQRIINLVGSWHSQLIEVMGAMGLREVRRLRGEVGRAMFFQDLEKEAFAPVFGRRKKTDAADVAPDTPPPLKRREFAGNDAGVRRCPSRFRNALGKYRVVRTAACSACGKCVEVCPYEVHRQAGKRMLQPRSRLCRGPETCRAEDRFCVDHCPEKALRVGQDPMWETLGDPRWTADVIASTWWMAETGAVPENGLRYRTGQSGGGFDRMDLSFPASVPDPYADPADVDLRLPLNKRNDGRPQVTLGFPVYGGGMSYGSISLGTMVARARAYAAFDSFTDTGEGGFPEELEAYEDHVITQVATGLFGVQEQTIQRVRIVEFKYAQGAKPGLGGHLLGDKVTPAVARMREAVEGSALFSPFPFHSVYSVEDHKKHVDWIKVVNPRTLVAVKVSTPTDVDMVAVGSYYAGAHILNIDGGYGGTGAAPDIAKKNIAMPLEYAIPKVHRFLEEEGIRDEMTLIASGGLRSAWDVAKAVALGADGVAIGTAELVALECVRCGVCESGRGCPRGIATTDPEIHELYDVEWARQRLTNLFNAWCVQLQDILWRLGMKSIRDLRGRNDLLTHRDYDGKADRR